MTGQVRLLNLMEPAQFLGVEEWRKREALRNGRETYGLKHEIMERTKGEDVVKIPDDGNAVEVLLSRR